MNIRLSIICALILCLSKISFSQSFSQGYLNTIKAADSLYRIKKYNDAALRYSDAFRINGGLMRKEDAYNAACAWSLSNNADSTYQYLNLSINVLGFSNYSTLSKDVDLAFFQKDPRWQLCLDATKKNLEKIEARYNKEARKKLLEIKSGDQEIRLARARAIEKLGLDHPIIDSLSKEMVRKDSILLLRMIASLEKYGYLGPDEVGRDASVTQFTVIQHAPLEYQIKYLPLMIQAAKDGKEYFDNVIMMWDRILMRQGKKQIYGSQVLRVPPDGKTFFPYTIEDPDNLDKRRLELGLGPIAEYYKSSGIIWNLEEYKKNIPKYDELIKEIIKKYGNF